MCKHYLSMGEYNSTDTCDLGIDTVISCLGRTALAAQIPLIKLAASPGSSVRWFLPSECGTDIKYGPSSASEKPHQQKLRVRAYLEEDDAVRRSGLKYNLRRDGPLCRYVHARPAGGARRRGVGCAGQEGDAVGEGCAGELDDYEGVCRAPSTYIYVWIAANWI